MDERTIPFLLSEPGLRAALEQVAHAIVQWQAHPDVVRQLHNLKTPMRRKIERYARQWVEEATQE
jgi:hypothetical protein